MSEASRTVVTNIGELCTCDPARGDAPGVIRDAALVADDGIVTWLGTTSELPSDLARGATATVDAGGAAVVPGFVDCHTHLVFAGERAAEFAARAAGAGYEEIARQGGGIASTVTATEAASVDDLHREALARARECLATGTTTVEVKTGYGRGIDGELRLLGVIERLADDAPIDVIATLLPLHSLPRDGGAAAHADEVAARLLTEATGRARFVDAFCDPAAWDVDTCRRVLSRARELGFALKLHAEQTGHLGGAMLAAELGATSADHLEHASAEDAAALARAGVVGVLLPGACLSLRTPPPDARLMLRAGMTLALATDCNPGTSNTTDMRLVIALGVGLFGLTPAQALGAATRGAALALGLEDRGVLTPGARADFSVLEADTHVDLAYRLGAVSVRAFSSGASRPPGRPGRQASSPT